MWQFITSHELQLETYTRTVYNSYTSSPGIYGIYKPEGPELMVCMCMF